MKAGFLGRFQPMHQGHYKVVEKYSENFEQFKIIIGSSDQSGTEENPLSFEERKEIIKSCFTRVEIVGLEDREDDEEWAEDLEKLGFDVIITGNKETRDVIEKYTGIAVEEPEKFDPGIYSSSEVRRRIKSDEEWRYLIPSCAKQSIEGCIERIKKSGVQYDFEPGWKRENSKYGITK